MKLRHLVLIGSLFPFLIAIVLFFGVLISAEDDDGSGGSSSWVTGMNLSAEVLKHQPMVEKYAKEYGISEYVPYLLAIIQVTIHFYSYYISKQQADEINKILGKKRENSNG